MIWKAVLVGKVTQCNTIIYFESMPRAQDWVSEPLRSGFSFLGTWVELV